MDLVHDHFVIDAAG